MTKMVLDWDAWDKSRKPQNPPTGATETLEALDERLRREHREARHSGKEVQWQMDLAGIYCDECLDAGYHFNLYPLDDFLRVIDGVEPETDFREVSFLPEP